MTRLIFSGSAKLQLTAAHLLRFLERQYDFVAYEVAGFAQDVLFLDYRQTQQGSPIWRPDTGLNGDETRPFHLEIWEFGPQHLQIELHDTIRARAAWTLSLTPATGQPASRRRAFFQRQPGPEAGNEAAVITLDRRPWLAPVALPAATLPTAVRPQSAAATPNLACL